MRFALVLLVACAKPAAKPEPLTVVVHDNIIQKDLFELAIDAKDSRVFGDGECVLQGIDKHAVVRCGEFAIRFRCADHPTGHPLSMLNAGVSYDLSCK
jgi:hypothetical protein